MENLSTLLTNLNNNQEELEFIDTGFTRLNEALDGGFLKKELVTLGAASGTGKSYIAGHFLYAAAKQGFKTAYFSLEITSQTVVSRLIGALCNIKPIRLLSGYLSQSEHDDKIKAIASLSLLQGMIDISDNIYTLEKIVETIKENSYEFVVIDYVQIIRHAKIQDEYSRLNEVANQLQEVAKEKDCCILLLSQLSNTVNREGAKNQHLEFKGSGGLANVTDLAFIFERNEFIQESGKQHVLLTLKKNRRGISGVQFELVFQYPGGKFSEYVK